MGNISFQQELCKSYVSEGCVSFAFSNAVRNELNASALCVSVYEFVNEFMYI